jgi:hypothetical protein
MTVSPQLAIYPLRQERGRGGVEPRGAVRIVRTASAEMNAQQAT